MFAVVEIMGRRTRAGMISDATIGGATLLRIEEPTGRVGPDGDPLCEYYAPQAIFAIRPCSHDEAVRAAWSWPAERPQIELPPAMAEAIAASVDDDDDWDEDDDEDGASPW